jgi:hypothetical protein
MGSLADSGLGELLLCGTVPGPSYGKLGGSSVAKSQSCFVAKGA